MTLPLTLPLSLSDLETEFSAPLGTPLSEFVKGGTYVPDNSENINVPTALPLSITDFFGAAATVPTDVLLLQDPDNLVGVFEVIDGGAHVVEEKGDLFPFLADDEQYVIDLRVRCNVGHLDSADRTPQLPGYSWERQRMNVLMGVDGNPGGDLVFNGVLVNINFTSATSGYLRVGYIRFSGASNPSEAFRQVLLDAQYHDQPDTNYGNFVLPDAQNEIRLKLTRGDSGTTSYQGGGTTRFACNYNLYVYQREEWVTLWKNIDIRGDGFAGTSTEWDVGGTLIVGNSTYEDGAECDLEITELAAFAGGTEIP